MAYSAMTWFGEPRRHGLGTFPHLSNLTDCQPWWRMPVFRCDGRRPRPSSGRTRHCAAWNQEYARRPTVAASEGLAEAIIAASLRGALIIGVCGGFQMLGETLSDGQSGGGCRH